VPLLVPNVDTNVIIRIDRLTTTDPAALAAYVFEGLRQPAGGGIADGGRRPFVLDDRRYQGAPTLLAGPNFGCGSSREPAVWALMGLGIRCVIGPSFGDIFRANCHQNGVLALTLDEAVIADIARTTADGTPVTVDLREQAITAADRTWAFSLPAIQRLALLEGLDDLDLALREAPRIHAWQQRDRQARPWAWPHPDPRARHPDGLRSVI
jgi:3-isopropylmalate/(R)-2-methylmalate dehydratase small subunit